LDVAACVLDRVLNAGGLSGKWTVGWTCARLLALVLALATVALVIRWLVVLTCALGVVEMVIRLDVGSCTLGSCVVVDVCTLGTGCLSDGTLGTVGSWMCCSV